MKPFISEGLWLLVAICLLIALLVVNAKGSPVTFPRDTSLSVASPKQLLDESKRNYPIYSVLKARVAQTTLRRLEVVYKSLPDDKETRSSVPGNLLTPLPDAFIPPKRYCASVAPFKFFGLTFKRGFYVGL